MLRRIFIALLVTLVIIQFFRPEKNQSGDFTRDITAVFAVPQDVQVTLKHACYDCHSNYTNYPWYSKIQPVAWWVQDHIRDGKKHLNFSVFADYPPKKQAHKLEEVAEMAGKKEMPLKSYTIIHQKAKLSEEQTTQLMNWARNLQHQIEAAL